MCMGFHTFSYSSALNGVHLLDSDSKLAITNFDHHHANYYTCETSWPGSTEKFVFLFQVEMASKFWVLFIRIFLLSYQPFRPSPILLYHNLVTWPLFRLSYILHPTSCFLNVAIFTELIWLLLECLQTIWGTVNNGMAICFAITKWTIRNLWRWYCHAYALQPYITHCFIAHLSQQKCPVGTDCVNFIIIRYVCILFILKLLHLVTTPVDWWIR